MNASYNMFNHSAWNLSESAHLLSVGNDRLIQNFVRCLQIYVAPVLAISGVLGNFVCILCLCGKDRPRGCTLAIALLTAESIQLLCLLFDWTTEIGLNIYVITGWCHVIFFIKRSSHFLNQWYLVTLMLSCVKTNLLTKKREAITAIVSLFAISIAIYLNLSLTNTLFYIGARPVCMNIHGHSLALMYFEHVHAIVNILAPLMINFAGFVYIIVCMSSIRYYSRDAFANFVLLHVALWLPLQLASMTNLIGSIQNGNSSASLHGFLTEEITRYVHLLNMTMNFCIVSCSSEPVKLYVRRRLLWFFCRIEEVEYITRGAQTSSMDLRLVSEV